MPWIQSHLMGHLPDPLGDRLSVRLLEDSGPATGKTAHCDHDASPLHAPGARHAQGRVEETIMQYNAVVLVVTLVLLLCWANPAMTSLPPVCT
jgi:hypothetical protein